GCTNISSSRALCSAASRHAGGGPFAPVGGQTDASRSFTSSNPCRSWSKGPGQAASARVKRRQVVSPRSTQNPRAINAPKEEARAGVRVSTLFQCALFRSLPYGPVRKRNTVAKAIAPGSIRLLTTSDKDHSRIILGLDIGRALP